MSSSRLPTDIAIIGMSALFPGARNVQTYWQNILNKVHAIQDAPDKWAGPHFEPNSTENDRIYTSKGGFLGNLAEFNPMEFGIMPNSVDGADPDHFLALKLSRDALKDAGYLDRPFNRAKAGIILGRGTYINRGFGTWIQHGMIVDQTLNLLQQLHPELDADTLKTLRKELKASLPAFTAEMSPGLVPNVVTGRIANRLDLMGPNYLIDAACSSSLLAVDLAIKELLSDRCDIMLAGGVQASNPPQVHMIFCQLGALSRSTIRPFDQSADGTLLSEGLGILVLKRLADAERDGDRIYAVIKAIGSSSDGKGLGLLAPRQEGQVLALERAYKDSGINPDTVTLVEAHGTGMPLGDKTEIQTLTQTFGVRQGLLPHRALGSVKSMIGHCIPASGAASLIKTALALYHKILPPTLCNQVNPALEIEKTSFYLNTEARPWIHPDQEVPRRAGVNAFGFGGINTHAILEEYTSPQAQDTKLLHQQWPSELLIFSRDGHQALIALINEIQRLLQGNSEITLAEIAYTLSKSPPGSHRLAMIAKDIPDLQTKLNFAVEKLSSSKRTQMQTRTGIYYAERNLTDNFGQIAFLFPGEGSQYPNMLADLCLYFPKVRAWFDFLDQIFIGTREQLPSQFIFPPPLGLSAEERKLAVEQIYSVDIATTAVFTTSMALYELLKDFNIPCDMMIGHSTGENTALVASGIMRVADRAKLMEEIQHLRQIYSDLEAADSIPKGQLLAVGAVDSSFLKQLIDSFQGRLYLAIDNCPNQVVLFGNADDIDKAATQIREVGGISTHLPFDRAYHTPLFEEVVSALAPYYKALEVGLGHTYLYSCATTDLFPTEPDAIRTLAAKQWSKTVRFREIIEKLYAQGARTFIEVGPSSNLTGFVGDILSSREHLAIASNSQRRAGLEQIQHLLARLFVKGIAVDMTPLYKERELTEINLHPIVSEKNQQVVPVLDLTMPVMRLAPSVIETIREKLHPAPEVHPEPVSTSICQQSSTGIELLFSQEKGDSLDKGAKGEEPASMYSLSSRRDNSPPYLPEDGVSPSQSDELLSEAFHNPVDTQFAVLSAHFELMQEFLASQSRVTTALYSSPVTYINSDENSLPANLENDSLTYEQYWSLLGQVIEQDSQHLYCQRVFDINLDRFLYDHTLGGQTSQRHPEVLPLPVIPFTVSMEILAQAAHYLVGGHKCVTSLYNIRSYRWLALERGSLTIDIQAWVQPGEDHQIQDVQVQLFQVGTSEEDNRLLVFEGTVRLSDQFPSSPAPMPFHFDQPKAYCLSDEELYRTGMFHGPQFQSVKHVRQVSQQGIEADLQVIGIDNFFSHIQQPIFQLDAPLLDAATQLVAYWVVELVGMNFHTFPFQITAFEQYGMPAPPGTTLIGRGMMHFKNERQIESSFDFLDETGRVIAHIEGLLKVFLNVPLKFHQCFASPQTAYWSDAGLQDETGLVCRRMARLPAGFLDELGGIIRLIGVHLILNEQEREFWYSLPENGSRRNEWLLGRVVAKDAVRQWAKERFNLDLAPVDIQILSTNLGKPLLYCPELEAIGPLPDLSISHSHNHFIAAVAMPGRRIGVDIQRLDSVRSHDLLEGAFTSLELDAIAQLPQQDKQTIILGAWCAKEAAAKAAGTGLKGNPRQWQMSQYDLTNQKVTITHADESFEIKLYCSDGEILAICHQ